MLVLVQLDMNGEGGRDCDTHLNREATVGNILAAKLNVHLIVSRIVDGVAYIEEAVLLLHDIDIGNLTFWRGREEQ